MTEYEKYIKAFQIFAKYPHIQYVGAEHDEMFAGPDPANVSKEDLAELKELGWNDYEDGCFQTFV